MPRKTRSDDEPYGRAICIDCRRVSARRLPERFPHICETCLFGDVAGALAQGLPVIERTRTSTSRALTSQ